MNEKYININKIAKIKGLKSTRSIRIAINKGKYIARQITVNGGQSYEILYSSLEPEIQEKLEDEEIRTTSLIPFTDSRPTFISESARMTSLARADIIASFLKLRKEYKTKKETEFAFLDLYNSGMLLPNIYKYIGKISLGTLRRWMKNYDEGGVDKLVPQRKFTSLTEYNTILNDEMKEVFLRFLLHPNKFKVGKAITLKFICKLLLCQPQLFTSPFNIFA